MNDFSRFRNQIVGHDRTIPTPGGKRPLVYADWAATGRLYAPIERYLVDRLGPDLANPHTGSTHTAGRMASVYDQARRIIKHHLHAGEDDLLFFAGFGMTAAINKLQRLLGLRREESGRRSSQVPLVILTHMEHHSNQITWNACRCRVKIIRPDDAGLPDLDHLEGILRRHHGHAPIVGSFSACSNVTGIITPIPVMARLIHAYGGLCFADYSASAPYVGIDMHPADSRERLDAVFFSLHKFLGGPGSSGVLAMNRSLYSNPVPDEPGGGTVDWTNPWGKQRYHADIESREDGGTPGFLQAVRGALAILLKERMNPADMADSEESLKERLLDRLATDPRVRILELRQRHRLPIVSFYVPGLHHNLIVRLLNDRFGIQTRGGCSCAGTYGHILLNFDWRSSKKLTDQLDAGDFREKPGWVRISLHPTTTPAEVDFICDALTQVFDRHREWGEEYRIDPHTAEFIHKSWRGERFDLAADFSRGWLPGGTQNEKSC